MIPKDLLINKPASSRITAIAEKELKGNEKPLFAVVGDLAVDSSYGEGAVYVTDKRIIAVGDGFDEGFISLDFVNISEISVKRMYGNAVLKAKTTGGSSIDLMRFTFAIADMCDAVADFISKVNEGETVENRLAAVEATFRNLRSFCPKCGRKLASPNSECLNCQGKKKMASILYRYIKPHMGKLIFCIFLSIVTTGAALVPPYVTSLMVDTIIPSKDKKMLVTIIIFLLGVYFAQYAIGALRSYILRIAGDGIIADLKKEIYAKAQYLPMKFYDKTSTGSVINRVNSDTTVLQQFMLRITQEAVVQLFMMIGIIVIMLSMNWKLTLLSLIPVPVVVIISRRFGKKIGPLYRRIWRRSVSISNILSDTIPGIRIVKSFSKEEKTIKKFDYHVDDWFAEDKKAAKVSAIFPAAITFLITCGSVIIWFVGGNMVIDTPDKLSLGILVSFITYTTMFYAPVNFFAGLSDSYQNALASTEKVLDIITAEPEHDFGKGSELGVMQGKIEFRNVNFSFDRSKKVLNDINFVIEPGDVVGIVGTTGSGKSTLINLLMRFYDDYEGEILVDGVNIRDIDMSYYRSQIGYVQQEPMMFKDTIFNNIAYSVSGAHPEQVLNAADIANAHGFISRLPDAYDTMLGERGVGLSGGEKQRLSIARAVLKNPGILIFDEATSAVDSETEKLIQDAINRLIRGRTTLMIAHRLSTLRKANKIIVVDKGNIIEFGSPEELMALKGKYYKLIKIQSMSEQVAAEKAAENFE
ncbi:MAG: ATP-binding cassette domain-containing protein [Clostridia bacterium]|nr:ATP-binding cassette domain-containing protein [Clostridia bacterium]